MTCQYVKDNLMGYLSGELTGSERSAFEKHVQSCSFCENELQYSQVAWQSLDVIPEQIVPVAVADQVLTTAKQTISTETELFNWTVWQRFLGPLAPVGLGLLAAIGSAVVLSIKIDLSLIHPLGLTAVGALWTGLYAVIFYFMFGTGKPEADSWLSFAQASLSAAGIFLAFTLASPVPNSIQFCRYYAVTQPIIERISLGGSFFLFGALYTLIPMSIAAYFSSNRSGSHPLAKGSMAGAIFVALLAPSIYLQCAPFALGVLLVWFGGALLGSILGGVIGYWVRYQFARS